MRHSYSAKNSSLDSKNNIDFLTVTPIVDDSVSKMLKPIKAFFKGLTEDQKQELKQARGLLSISIGQATHEGELLAATFDLINDSFHSCIIQIDDSLQRHTMALNSDHDPDFFYALSLKEGQLWLERNKQFFERLTIPTKVIHWNTWLYHSEFQKRKEMVEYLIKTDANYKAAFEESIGKFLTKYIERLGGSADFQFDRAKKLSFDFVIEECAAMTLWTSLDAQFELYPNGHNAAMEATRSHFVTPKSPELLRPLVIKFRNAGQLKPQVLSFRDK